MCKINKNELLYFLCYSNFILIISIKMLYKFIDSAPYMKDSFHGKNRKFIWIFYPFFIIYWSFFTVVILCVWDFVWYVMWLSFYDEIVIFPFQLYETMFSSLEIKIFFIVIKHDIHFNLIKLRYRLHEIYIYNIKFYWCKFE